ncbi:MAG: bifunctional riboflavin kinase/FAD synthetase [Bacillota bacterium]|nr:bifunctional riboflavin kinase/FAD synthetase [Bacillota bacterium]MDW7682528.1 bifunctional riboflavin kinase/FAD synthetase [Bacillota bacterium]
MQIVQGIDQFRQVCTGETFVALGNFDGVHVGHRKIIDTTVSAARRAGGTSAVLIFMPHPLSVLCPDRAPLLLQTVEDRIRMLGEAGVDYVIVHPFTREFASTVPEVFAADILAGKLGATGVVVGYDYSFGQRGTGTPQKLQRYGEGLGFWVHIVDPVSVDGVPVGSSVIRGYLSEGRVTAAAGMLGYPFFLRGQVVHGDGRGRQLGFPTANVHVDCDIIRPANGVYLTEAVTEGQRAWALTNVGKRPTFCKEDGSVEVHLLDLKKNLYGNELIVRFLQKIREEQAFRTADELASQIRQDVELARSLIARGFSH